MRWFSGGGEACRRGKGRDLNGPEKMKENNICGHGPVRVTKRVGRSSKHKEAKAIEKCCGPCIESTAMWPVGRGLAEHATNSYSDRIQMILAIYAT